MEEMNEMNVAAPCGIFCGACRAFLLNKKDLFEVRGYKQGCIGCRIRFKKCAFIRRDCPALRNKEIDFCYECKSFPCNKLKKLDSTYRERHNVHLIENLKRIKKVGYKKWIKEQEELYACPECTGEICIHDKECYDCGLKINPNKN
ncbi:MAG: DUF3795 domain-containing protein [Promethearchaeota archaeon]